MSRSLAVFESIDLSCDDPSSVCSSLPEQSPNQVSSQIGNEDLPLLVRMQNDLMRMRSFLTFVIERQRSEGEVEDLVRSRFRGKKEPCFDI